MKCNIQRLLEEKKSNYDFIMSSIPTNSKIALGMAVAEPRIIMQDLANNIDNIGKVYTYFMHASQDAVDTLLKPELMEKINPRSLFQGSHEREVNHLCRECGVNGIELVPGNFSSAAKTLMDIGIHYLMIQVSPPDASGRVSLGTNADYSQTIVRAKVSGYNNIIILAQINKNIPFIRNSEQLLHFNYIDGIVEADIPLMEIHGKSPTKADLEIAEIVASQINDGDTIQFGVGGVPAEVANKLINHSDLGCHSELMSDSIMNLIEQGVMTGMNKTLFKGKHVFTLTLGTRKLYEAMNNHPDLYGLEAEICNDAAIVAQQKNMKSVNAAIEVDLWGQVNAEFVKGFQHSAVGGQLDFVRGAQRSRNGASFVCLNSITKTGLSKIVPKLTAPVTDPRVDIDNVVTEFGIARLRGLTLRERIDALINIAHPDHRVDLRKACFLL